MENTIKIWDKWTILFYSDAVPVTVISVEGNRIWVRQNKTKMVNNEWEILEELEPEVLYFSKRKNGNIVPVWESATSYSRRLTLKVHYKYYDVNF